MRPGNDGAGDRYLLNITPVMKTTEVIDKKQPSTTRESVRLTVAYELIDQQTGQTIHSGKTFSQVVLRRGAPALRRHPGREQCDGTRGP